MLYFIDEKKPEDLRYISLLMTKDLNQQRYAAVSPGKAHPFPLLIATQLVRSTYSFLYRLQLKCVSLNRTRSLILQISFNPLKLSLNNCYLIFLPFFHGYDRYAHLKLKTDPLPVGPFRPRKNDFL